MKFAIKITCGGQNYSFENQFGCDLFSAETVYTDYGLRLEITPNCPLTFEKITASAQYDFNENDRIFLNGYQSWTDSREFSVTDKMRGIKHIPKSVVRKYGFDRYGDYDFAAYTNKRGFLHGFSYGYIRSDDKFFLVGSLSEKNGFTIIYTDTNVKKITLEKECEGGKFNKPFTAFDIALLNGTEAEVFDGYFKLMNVEPPKARRLTGYTSWYNHYQNISEKIIADNLESMTEFSVKSDIFQVDDGYQTAVGDWLSVDNAKFPKGMAEISERIHDKKLLAGIWLAPFVCEKNSEIFQNHKDWLLCGNDGNPVYCGCNWSGFYALDFYNDSVRKYIREVFDTVLNEWKFDLVKLDFLYAVCAVSHNGYTRGQIMCEAMDFLRECVGDKLILGCGVPLAPAFGKVDYCRIGCDVSLSWDDSRLMQMMHRERVSTKNTIANTIYRRQLDKRGFLNDPDVFLLREDNMKMSEQQKKILTFVNSMFGSVLFTSDNVSEYSEKQRDFVAKCISLRNAADVKIQTKNDEVTVNYTLDGEQHKFGFNAKKGYVI